MPKAELDQLVAGLERHPQVAVMSDEIYGEMLYDGAEHVSLLRYPELARPADPARRLEQDLCDDRLAHGLRRVAARRCSPHAERLAINCHSCVNAAAQLAGIAALNGPREPVAAHGHGLRRAPRVHRRGAEQPARLPLRQPGRRLLRLSQHHRHRPRRPHACRPSCWTRPGSRPSPAPASAHSARGICAFSYANSLEAIGEAIERIRRFLGNLPRSDAATHRR